MKIAAITLTVANIQITDPLSATASGVRLWPSRDRRLSSVARSKGYREKRIWWFSVESCPSESFGYVGRETYDNSAHQEPWRNGRLNTRTDEVHNHTARYASWRSGNLSSQSLCSILERELAKEICRRVPCAIYWVPFPPGISSCFSPVL